MPSSLNLSGVFSDAIAEHLTIIRQFVTQEDSFERAAVGMTDCLLAGKKICGAATVAVQPTHSILRLNWWDASARRVAPFLPLPLPPTLLF